MNKYRTRAIVILAAALGAVSTGVGCKSTQGGGMNDPDEASGGRMIDRATPHAYPPVSLDSSGREHVIVMQGPHPGWRLEFDAVQWTKQGRIVYATVRQPDPERMYAQVITERRLGATVPSTDPVELVVRTVEHDDRSDTGAYHPAARVD